jgi:SHS2 domain-containing protein
MKFEFLEHTADIKFRAYGRTFANLLENSALALSNHLSRNKKISSVTKKKISVSGEDKESLLYNFLEEILFLLDTEQFILSKSKIKVTDNLITADLQGDNVSKYDIDHVKAITYSEMYIKKNLKNWECQVVIDV